MIFSCLTSYVYFLLLSFIILIYLALFFLRGLTFFFIKHYYRLFLALYITIEMIFLILRLRFLWEASRRRNAVCFVFDSFGKLARTANTDACCPGRGRKTDFVIAKFRRKNSGSSAELKLFSARVFMSPPHLACPLITTLYRTSGPFFFATKNRAASASTMIPISRGTDSKERLTRYK